MDDSKIVDMYWNRDESAIRESERKYGRYLMKIARNILLDEEDSKEVVNDSYHKAWNTIPPSRPGILSVYLGRITRQLSIDRFRRRSARKRGGSEYIYSLSELEECVDNRSGPEQKLDFRVLAESMNEYLRRLPSDRRNVFIYRYYYMDSIQEIADYTGFGESRIKSMLHRTRIGLKKYLQEEGYEI